MPGLSAPHLGLLNSFVYSELRIGNYRIIVDDHGD